jgi:hypothetical protein
MTEKITSSHERGSHTPKNNQHNGSSSSLLSLSGSSFQYNLIKSSQHQQPAPHCETLHKKKKEKLKGKPETQSRAVSMVLAGKKRILSFLHSLLLQISSPCM